MNLSGLSELERDVLSRSANLDVTRRRTRGVLVTIAVLYVGITAAEKVAYGRAVLVYKTLIQKLVAEVERLEAR